ncbi:MAG: dihydroorotase, partial [Thermoguttaceae bacterium]|nr:dihydroorotase [Thermoguttaceae bacterium]
MSNALLIQNGRVVDPAQNLDQIADLLIVDGKIAALGADAASQAPEDAVKLDATDKIGAPGLIDMHVHLREP